MTENLREQWLERWPEALAAWGFYIRLKPPLICATAEEASREGLSTSFAMIRLNDHSIVISEEGVRQARAEDLAVEILAHEIGHHVYAPADLGDMGRMLARMRRALPGLGQLAPMIGNLWTDLLINDRLQRQNGLRMDEVYRRIVTDNPEPLWQLYMRIYEILWGLPRQSFARGTTTEELEGDAQLGARLVRSFARDWLRGSGRFAALCLPYLAKDPQGEHLKAAGRFFDAVQPGQGEIPAGLAAVDPGEEEECRHPAWDSDTPPKPAPTTTSEPGAGNYREPFEYGQILKALGVKLDDRDLAVRYYRERALPWLIPFPSLERPRSSDPIPEGLSVWDPGEALEKISWIETAARSPVLIPGYTTLEQVFADSEGGLPQREPVDLDLYVDCSGSMPDPAQATSYLTLAGAILALSALRAGASVQATLWSGANEFETTGGFTRNEQQILRILCGYFGGGTAFPLHILRTTYLENQRRRPGRKAHILVISDDGVTTIFAKDEKGNAGRNIASQALEAAGGGGTFLLNLWRPWQDDPDLVEAAKIGFDIAPIAAWEDLVVFSRDFARKRYGQTKESAHEL